MNNQYSISDFYLFLKLGLWKRGYVANWGAISSILTCKRSGEGEFSYLGNKTLTDKDNIFFGKKPVSYYHNQLHAKHALGIGLYLLDFYLSDRQSYNNENTYILVICVCRSNLQNKEYIYYLQVTNSLDIVKFRIAIENRENSRKRTSVFRQKPSQRTFDSSPINSVRRKH